MKNYFELRMKIQAVLEKKRFFYSLELLFQKGCLFEKTLINLVQFYVYL